jgi:hypothetical protein
VAKIFPPLDRKLGLEPGCNISLGLRERMLPYAARQPYEEAADAVEASTHVKVSAKEMELIVAEEGGRIREAEGGDLAHFHEEEGWVEEEAEVMARVINWLQPSIGLRQVCMAIDATRLTAPDPDWPAAIAKDVLVTN